MSFKRMLKKRDIITASIRNWQNQMSRGHKFGIEFPESVEEALALDAKTLPMPILHCVTWSCATLHLCICLGCQIPVLLRRTYVIILA